MLCLSRKVGQRILIAGEIEVQVLEFGDKVRLGITAERDIPVHRGEVADRIAAEISAKSVVEESAAV